MSDKKATERKKTFNPIDTFTLFKIFLFFFIGAIVAVILFKTSVNYPELVDKYYTQVFFRIVTLPAKIFISIFPFSVFELSIALLVLFVIYYFVKTIVKTIGSIIRKQKHPYIHSVRFLLTTATIASYIICIFVFSGGLSYNNVTFAEKSGYILSESTTEELEELCLFLGEQAGIARSKLPVNDKGVINPDISVYELANKAQDGYKAIEKDFPYLGGFYPNAKPVASSIFMCYTNITGIYPYVIPEPLVNYKTPIMSLPATIAHEMAHQRGFSREDEANYIAFLASVNNPDPLFQYSGYYLAFNYALDQLYAHNSEAAQRVASSIDSGIFRDRAASSEFWKQFETPKDIVATISETVNNEFLETVHVEDGTHSYGRMVDLLLAARKAELNSNKP